MPASTIESRPPHCRWFQFRLRTLFVVTAVAAVLSAIGAEAFERCQAWQWERRFDELIKLMVETIHPVSTTLVEDSSSLEFDDVAPNSGGPVQE